MKPGGRRRRSGSTPTPTRSTPGSAERRPTPPGRAVQRPAFLTMRNSTGQDSPVQPWTGRSPSSICFRRRGRTGVTENRPPARRAQQSTASRLVAALERWDLSSRSITAGAASVSASSGSRRHGGRRSRCGRYLVCMPPARRRDRPHKSISRCSPASRRISRPGRRSNLGAAVPQLGRTADPAPRHQQWQGAAQRRGSAYGTSAGGGSHGIQSQDDRRSPSAAQAELAATSGRLRDRRHEFRGRALAIARRCVMRTEGRQLVSLSGPTFRLDAARLLSLRTFSARRGQVMAARMVARPTRPANS